MMSPEIDLGFFYFGVTMSIRVMSMVWNTKLSSTDKLVLLYYADRAADDGSKIFPGVKTVARNTGLSERTVQYVTKKMIKNGYLIQVGWSDYRTKMLRINISRLLQDQQPVEPLTPHVEEELGGCNTFAPVVQMTAKKGERAAPNTSSTISKPSYQGKKSWKKRSPQEEGSHKYTPFIDPALKRAIQHSKENSQI